MRLRWMAALALTVAAQGQVKTGSAVDFSGAGATLPVKAGPGASAPVACAANKEMYIKTDAPAGQQLFLCNASGTGWNLVGDGGGGGTGAVASVFGRTGAVTAAAGDYGFWQITGTVSDTQVASGIAATKIGSGTVGNAAFGYLANVTSDIQQQLNGKAASAHTHAMAGDVSGDSSGTTVGSLRNRPISTAAPSNGQALVWNGATYQWEPQFPAGGGGAAMASGLGDLNVTKTSDTVLTIGERCSAATPCNVRLGSTTYALIAAATVTLTAGSGTAYIYVDTTGGLTVGHNMTLACSGACTAQSGVPAFPARTIPLFTWNAVNNRWVDGGGADQRAFLSGTVLMAGTGVQIADAGSRTVLGVDPATVPTYVAASAALDFGSIAAGACSADLTFAAPGARAGDAVAAGWPAGLEAGLTGTMRVSADDTVAVRLCNLSGGSVNPAAATYGATIVRSF